MLMRPPTIVDENDNLSHLNSQSDARQSSKSKNKVKRKQTSLTMKNKNLYTAKDSESKEKQKEQDNGSVHSHASGRSKRSKKKQSLIGLNKPRGAYMTLNSPRKSEQDEQIRVLSYQDINQQSQKKNKNKVIQYSEVKNDYQGPNLNKQANQFSNPTINSRANDQYLFKNVFQNSSDLIKNQSSKQSYQDQVPVVKLVEAKSKANQSMKSPYTNVTSPKMVEKKQTKRLGQLFQENRKLIQNQSSLGVSGIPSQVGNSALGAESRRSRSKLGQLFKQKSKQKDINNSSKVQFSQNASSNYQSMSQLHLNLQSNIEGPAKKDGLHGLGGRKSKQKQHVGIKNIPQKVLEQSAFHFQGAQQVNKSDLNLSLSRNSPAATKLQYNRFGSQINNKDSVCFNIEPERQKKRKGLGLASRLNSESDQLIKVSGNLVSKQFYQPNSNQSAHQRLKMNFYQNEKYLIQSGAFQTNDPANQNEQIKRREQINIRKQKEAEKERAQNERLERIRYEKQRQAERKKEQQNIYQEKMRKQQEKKKIERIRKQEQNKKQEQRKLQENIREQKRLKLEQQKKDRMLEIEREKEKQIKQDKKKEKEIEKELQRKRLIEEQQEAKAKIQRQRLKIAYKKEREQIRRSHEESEKEKSIVQGLQNDSYHQDRAKKNKVKQSQFSRIPSSFSKQNSCKSQKSQESRKSTKKKQSVIAKNKTKHYVGEISPRAEQSFYEQQNDHKNKNQQAKLEKIIDQPRKLMSFSEQQDLSYEPKVEYKTDTYFYDKSLKAPSSKPPLSRKSSASKSKPKQGMITKKSAKDSQIKIKGPSGGNGEKKLSLVELAMRKNYQRGSQSQNQSQDSFRSRQKSVESYGSRNSSGSKGSRKKESVIRLKQNTYSGYNRPPLQRKNSSQNQDSLKHRTWKHAQQMQQQSRYSNTNKITEVESKIRVIKGCSFIDERGRLVENGNMMIKGNQVAGTTRNNQFTEKKMIERLINSRQKRRSKSRQRSLNRSRTSGSIQKNNSKYSNSNSQTQKAFFQSEAYSESEGRYETSGSNFYGNTRNDQSYYQEEGNRTNYGNSQYRNRAPQNLQQFMKPIEQAGVARVKNQTQNIYYERQRQNNKKRTMQRTQKRM